MDGLIQRPDGALEFRATRRQLWALSGVGGITLLVVGPIMLSPIFMTDPVLWDALAYNAIMLAAVGAAIILLLPRLMGRQGIVADHLGIRRNRRAVGGYIPWNRIVEFRTQRRFGRTRIIVYLDSGQVSQLVLPYDGNLLAHDPGFDDKLRMLQDAWHARRDARESTRPG